MTRRTRRIAIGLLVAGNAVLVVALVVVGLGWLWGTADVTCSVGRTVCCEVLARARRAAPLNVCYRVGVACRNGATARLVRCTTTRPGVALVTSISVQELREAKGAGTCDAPVSAVVRWVKIKIKR